MNMDKVAKNTFSGGILTDYNNLVTPNTFMTNCLNGTNITFNGNELVLQNDSGNTVLKYIDSEGEEQNVKLEDGYVPVGLKEYNGILYIASVNKEGDCEIGSYPSLPKEENLIANFDSNNSPNDPNDDLINFPKEASIPLKFIVSSPENKEGTKFTDKENMLKVCDFGEIIFDNELGNHLNNKIKDLNGNDLKNTYAKTYTVTAKLQNSNKIVDVSNLLLNNLKYLNEDGIGQEYSIPSYYYGNCIINFERSYPYDLKLTGIPKITNSGNIEFDITFIAKYDRQKCPDGFKFGPELKSSNYTYNNNIITNFRSILFLKYDENNKDYKIVAEAIPQEDSSTNVYNYLTPELSDDKHKTFQINHNDNQPSYIYCNFKATQSIDSNIFCTDVKIVSNFDGNVKDHEQVASLSQTISTVGEITGLFTLDSFVYRQTDKEYIINSIIYVDRPKDDYKVCIDVLPFNSDIKETYEVGSIDKTISNVVTFTINNYSIKYTTNKYNLVRIYAISKETGATEEIDFQYLIQYDENLNQYYTNFKNYTEGRSVNQILSEKDKKELPKQEYIQDPVVYINNVGRNIDEKYCIIINNDDIYNQNSLITKINYTKRITFEAGRHISQIKVDESNTLLPNLFIAEDFGRYIAKRDNLEDIKYLGKGLSIENTSQDTLNFTYNIDEDSAEYSVQYNIENSSIQNEEVQLDDYAKKTFTVDVFVEYPITWDTINLSMLFEEKYNSTDRPIPQSNSNGLIYDENSNDDNKLFDSVFNISSDSSKLYNVLLREFRVVSDQTGYAIIFTDVGKSPTIGENLDLYKKLELNFNDYFFISNRTDDVTSNSTGSITNKYRKVFIKPINYKVKIYRSTTNSEAPSKKFWVCSLKNSSNKLTISNIETQNIFTKDNNTHSEKLLTEQLEYASNILYENNETKQEIISKFIENKVNYSINVEENNGIYYNRNNVDGGSVLKVDSDYYLINNNEYSVIVSEDEETKSKKITRIPWQDIFNQDPNNTSSDDNIKKGYTRIGNTDFYLKNSEGKIAYLVSLKQVRSSITPVFPENGSGTDIGQLDTNIGQSSMIQNYVYQIQSFKKIMLYNDPEII